MPRSLSTSRRTAIAAASATGAGLVLAACGNAGGGRSVTDAGGDEQAPALPSGTKLAALDDIPVGTAVAVTGPDDDPVIVTRTSQTEVVAFSGLCTHQGCVVKPAGKELNCPCHESTFDMRTGKALAGPAEDPLPSIAVRVDGGNVVTGKA